MNAQSQNKTNDILPQSSMSVQTGLLQRKCACGTHTVAGSKCDGCKNEHKVLQRKSSGKVENDEAPPIVNDVLRSSGQPLDASARDFFEPRFGHDFSRVRVHTNTKAAESVGAVNAAAYTVGQNIVFGQGLYAPNTTFGRKLLAHELTHVIQQKNSAGAIPQNLKIEPAHDHFEQEADVISQSVGEKNHASPANSTLSAPHIQRGLFSSIGKFFGAVGDFIVGVGKGIARVLGSENYSKEELESYLSALKTGNKIEANYDSDNKARAVVHRQKEFAALDTATKTLLIQEMLKGATLGADEGSILELLRQAAPAEKNVIVSAVGRDHLWDNFSGANLRSLEAITLTAADFSSSATVGRLKALPPNQLAEYRDQAQDPDVIASINKILAMQNITAPVKFSANYAASGTATFSSNGFDVTVLPDVYNAPIGNDKAYTYIKVIASDINHIRTDNQNIVTSFDPLAPVGVEVQTKYSRSKGEVDAGKSGYGRGTTDTDKFQGNTGLRFHEKQHGVDIFEFLEKNPPPKFTGARGMSLQDFNKAADAYGKDVTDYQNKVQRFTIERSDCPGTPISAEGLLDVGLPATLCRDLNK